MTRVRHDIDNDVNDRHIGSDVIDQLAGLQAGSRLHALRHQREKVAIASQGSHDTLFDPGLQGIGLDERLLVAWYACRLAGAQEAAAHYRVRLDALPTTAAHAADVTAVADGAPGQVPTERLRALLAFTRTLTERPVEGDQAALQRLLAVGISTPAVVALAQLIAFISYQIRVVAGLKAMQRASQQPGQS